VIKIQVNGTTGFAVHPNCNDKEKKEFLAAMPKSASVAFIDLASSKEIMSLISDLEKAGHQVTSFADHHLDPRRRDELNNTRELRSKLRERAVILTRREAASCIGLVENNGWVTLGASVVFFHADFDGFLSFLKGCGTVYPQIETDANILDGGKKNRSARVSNIGQLLADAHENLVPRFSTDPDGHHAVKQRIYQTVADFVSGKDRESIVGLYQEAEKATALADRNAYQLVADTELIQGGVAFADLMPYIESGEPLSLPLWKREVLPQLKPELIASVGMGHMDKQVYLELPRFVQNETDLRDFLPEGIEGRVPFRVQVPLDRLPEFLAKWQAR
jgi:hypothetical protein